MLPPGESPRERPLTARERIAQRLAAGLITGEMIARAERAWQERLAAGLTAPNGETLSVALDAVYHVLVDDRIARQPERIERIVQGIFQIRSAEHERRRALSRWNEADRTLTGYAILTPTSELLTAHVVDQRTMRRLMRQGVVLWTQ